MFNTLLLHKQKITLLLLLMISCLLVTWALGSPKAWAEIDWVDVIGEGGSACAVGLWVVFILGSRPQGRVTNLLTLGLGFMMLAFWQDALDEFIRLPSQVWWDQWFESATMPLGILVLTYGMFHWYQEQLLVNHTLKKREQLFREHAWVDRVTNLSRAVFLKRQLALIGDTQLNQDMALIMLDVAKFSVFNRQFGQVEGDRFLYQLAEYLQLNMREQDLLTRYAADRFAIILPATSLQVAKYIADELQDAVAHFHYRLKESGHTYLHTLNVGVAACKGCDGMTLMQQANQSLQINKKPSQVA
jgi:diguanylate cyclase (GGDEF)-like protein